jgi:hypothetical protein
MKIDAPRFKRFLKAIFSPTTVQIPPSKEHYLYKSEHFFTAPVCAMFQYVTILVYVRLPESVKQKGSNIACIPASIY